MPKNKSKARASMNNTNKTGKVSRRGVTKMVGKVTRRAQGLGTAKKGKGRRVF
jgi:hypothetical protein